VTTLLDIPFYIRFRPLGVVLPYERKGYIKAKSNAEAEQQVLDWYSGVVRIEWLEVGGDVVLPVGVDRRGKKEVGGE